MVKDGALLRMHLAKQRETLHGCSVIEMIYSSGQCRCDEITALRVPGRVCRALHSIAVITFHCLPWLD